MNKKNNVRFSQEQAKGIWHYFIRERNERMKDKDKSIKSKMKSWIMLSDKELDDTQVYMEEQEEAQKVADAEAVDTSADTMQEIPEESAEDLYSDRAGLYSDKYSSEQPYQGKRKLSREEEIEQLMQEVGQEVVDDQDEDGLLPRRRRKRHKDKTADKDREGRKTDKTGQDDKTDRMGQESRIKKADFADAEVRLADGTEYSEEPDNSGIMEQAGETGSSDKSTKSGGIGKVVTGGIGILLVLIIGGLGYQNQSLQSQNQQLKTQISALQNEKKKAEKEAEEQALQTKNADGVVENTDKMLSSVKVGDKEYKLLAKVSDFTKDGWKLEALRTENATLVPGGKLEKDAFLTNTEGKKIGVIIRNMSDKNQKVSDCIITKLVFSKEMFDGNITLPENLGFDSTEKELKAAGFKKDADGSYCYTSKKIKDDTIKMEMADGESVSDIILERAVTEEAASTQTSSQASTQNGVQTSTQSGTETSAN